MNEALSAIFWGILTFSLLVFLHEGGHFLAARAFGVKVHEFFIGLPGPSLSFKRNATRYGVTAIPLGGYVKIAGMEGDGKDDRLVPLLRYFASGNPSDYDSVISYLSSISESEETPQAYDALIATLEDWGHITFNEETGVWECTFVLVEDESDEELIARAKVGTYLGLNRYKRIAVLLSGVFVNIVVAIAIFTIVLSVFGFYDDLGSITPLENGPAAASGLIEGDRVLSVNNHKTKNFEEISQQISKFQPGENVYVEYQRNGNTALIEVALAQRPDDAAAPYMGIQPYLEHTTVTVPKAFGMSFGYIKMTLKALAGFFSPATFQESVSQSSSIVGIAVITAKAAESSALDYAWIVAAISLSLGIMNMLPIPPLDGGKVLMEIIGGIRKKDVPIQVQTKLSMIGFGLLMILVVVLMYNDISRFF